MKEKRSMAQISASTSFRDDIHYINNWILLFSINDATVSNYPLVMLLKKLPPLLLFTEAWLYVRVDWVSMLVILKAPDGNDYVSPVYKPLKGKPKVSPDLFLPQTLDYTCVSITNAIYEGGCITIAAIVQVT